MEFFENGNTNTEEALKENDLKSKENDFEAKIETLEQERGQLTAEVMSKDILITKLEKETSSLKSEVTQLETSHANIVAEHERKFLLLSEEMSAKVAEVSCFKVLDKKGHVQKFSTKSNPHFLSNYYTKKKK